MGDAGTAAHRPLASAWLAGALLALAAAPAGAAVFVVDTSADTLGGTCPANPAVLPGAGSCSLRDAIVAANLSTGDDLILFAPSVFSQTANKVITLASPLPDLAATVEINATSSPLLPQRVQGIVIRAGATVSELFAVAAGEPRLDDLGLEGAGFAIEAGRLVLEHSADATIAGAITGAGELEKRGAARLVLTGTNTYTGETLIAAGTLQGDTRSIPGDVDDDGVLVFDQETTDPQDFLGAIRGSGRLEKIGAGTLFLQTANSYTGGTTVSAGTLIGFAGSGTTGGSLQGAIQNDAILVFEQAAEGTFSGTIRGSGRVEKTGPALLVLSGSNTYTGGTTVSAGTLQGAAAAIPGDVVIASGAQLRFEEPGSGTSSGRITGGGGLAEGLFSVEKSGAGTLTLTGVNSYAGGTLVSGGTLRGNTQSLQGTIQLAAGTSLVFDQSFAGAYTGLLTGTGALRKEGAGTLVLTQDLSTGFSPVAPTTIAGGRLEVGRPGDGIGAILPGDVTIASGGALGGIGVVGGRATAQAGGTISPGNSIGVLRVGETSFLGGSFLEVEVTPAPDADRLEVDGTAFVQAGARVRVIPGEGDYPDEGAGEPVVILNAAAIDGLFDQIPEDTFAFLEAELTQTATQVLLTVESNGKQLDDFAQTPNQRAVGAALEQAQAGGDPDLATVFGELNTLQTADVPSALDAMTGEQLTEFATARLAVGQRFLAGIDQRIGRSAGHPSEPLFAGRGPGGAGPVASRRLPASFAPAAFAEVGALAAVMAMQDLPLDVGFEPEPPGFGAWLDGYGIFGDVSGTSGADDFDTTVWGVSAGLDFRPAPEWIAGVAGGYARSQLDFDSLEGRPEVDTAQGAAYVGYASKRLEAGAAFRYAWNRMSADRDIAFAPPSTLSRSAESDFDGSDLGGRVGAAVHLVDVAGFAVRPFASLTYTHLQQDAFDESGAGSLDLAADEEEIDSLLLRLGARLHTVVQIGDATWLRPELRAAWVHEFGDRERKLEARIGGFPGATMTIRGAELPRDAAEVGFGWTVGASDRLRFFAGYDLAVNTDLLQHSVGLGLEVLW